MSTTVPSTARIGRVPQSTRQLKHLATLSGLTRFEADFVAELQAISSLDIPTRYRAVLAAIWQRHGEGCR